MAKVNGETLWRRRTRKRITQAQLGDEVKLDQTTVSDVEIGRNTDRTTLDLLLAAVRRMPANPRVKRARRAA